jgi:hypothetical protein
MSEQTKEIPEIELQVNSLPSRGVPYPKGSWVKYRTYTWGEVRKSSTATLGVVETLQNSLSGITTSFDKMDLTVADALYLGIARKISTFSGMQIEVPYVCRYCGSSNKGHFTHRDISFRDLPDEVTAFPLEAELDGKLCTFSPMTVRQYLELNSGKYEKILDDGKIDEVAVQATWIKNMPYEKAYSLIKNLRNIEDFEIITEMDALLLHDMERMEFTCSNKKCGQTNSIRLEGREALLRPFRERKGLNGGRIRISKGTESTDNPVGSNGVQQGNNAQV